MASQRLIEKSQISATAASSSPPRGAGENGPAPSKEPAMASKGQVAERVVVNGPDPRQTAYWDGLADRTYLELSSEGAPESVRVGMKGSDTTTWYGDAGPLGGLPAPNYGARNSFPALNADQALPGSSSAQITPQTIKSILGDFQS